MLLLVLSVVVLWKSGKLEFQTRHCHLLVVCPCASVSLPSLRPPLPTCYKGLILTSWWLRKDLMILEHLGHNRFLFFSQAGSKTSLLYFQCCFCSLQDCHDESISFTSIVFSSISRSLITNTSDLMRRVTEIDCSDKEEGSEFNLQLTRCLEIKEVSCCLIA